MHRGDAGLKELIVIISDKSAKSSELLAELKKVNVVRTILQWEANQNKIQTIIKKYKLPRLGFPIAIVKKPDMITFLSYGYRPGLGVCLKKELKESL